MSQTSIIFWRNSDLGRVLTGELISDFGSQIGDLALPIFAATALDASAGQMASLLSAEYVPRIVIGLAAAGWIDRVRRRPVLIGSNLARFIALSLVAFAAWQQVLTVEHLYIVAILMAGLDVLFASTFAAYVPTLVPMTMLTAANGARASSSAAASVLGPALAGALISIVGAPAAIASDGLSFLASVVALASVRTTESRRHPQLSVTSPVEAILQGWHALLREPTLRAFAATAFTANFFYRVIMAVYVLYLTRDLGLSAATVGLIFGFGGGAGVLVGSLLAAPVARAFGTGRSMIAAHLLFGLLGLPLALSSFSPRYAAALVFASEFLQLAVNAVYMVNRTSVEQALSPPDMRGRIQSSRSVFHAVAGILGLTFGGLLGTAVSPAAAIVVGVLGGLTSFICLLFSPLRNLHELPG
ncbi:MAG: MFS transporter [Chloroflexi bacterium]|nr:MFS transporter [Chloroflexota bacterium]